MGGTGPIPFSLGCPGTDVVLGFEVSGTLPVMAWAAVSGRKAQSRRLCRSLLLPSRLRACSHTGSSAQRSCGQLPSVACHAAAPALPQVSTPNPPQYIHGLRIQCGNPAVTNCGAPLPVAFPPLPPGAVPSPSPAPLFAVSNWSDWLGASKGPASYGGLCPCGTFVSVSARRR